MNVNTHRSKAKILYRHRTSYVFFILSSFTTHCNLYYSVRINKQRETSATVTTIGKQVCTMRQQLSIERYQKDEYMPRACWFNKRIALRNAILFNLSYCHVCILHMQFTHKISFICCNWDGRTSINKSRKLSVSFVFTENNIASISNFIIRKYIQ